MERARETVNEVRALSPTASGLLALAAAAVTAVAVSITQRRRRSVDEERAAEAARLSKTILRLLSDEEPDDSAGAYAYAFHQLDDNLPSLVEGVGRLKSSHRAVNVLVTNVSNSDLSSPIEGWSGATKLAPLLEGRLDEDEDSVALVPFPFTDMVHTLNEAKAVVSYCEARGIRDLVVVAPPFHLPRAAMTIISVAIREVPHLRIWAQPGPAQPWGEAAQHSQGASFASRSHFIDSEMGRIAKYSAVGDIASTEQILAYLDARDTVGQLAPVATDEVDRRASIAGVPVLSTP